jgi:hypothetical protein
VLQDDFLMRQVQQLSAAIARVFDGHAAGSIEEGLEELRAAGDALLGPNLSLVDILDAGSLGALLGADKMRALSRLRTAEAILHETDGDDARAGACRRDALDYGRWARDADPNPEDDEQIAALEAHARE